MKLPNFIEVQGGPITLVFSSSGRAFFSERVTGNIWEVVGDKDYRLIKHLPITKATGHHEAGVIGIALDPDFDKNKLLYAFYTVGEDLSNASNKVVRFSIDTGKEETLISNIPGGRIHNGGIITFGPDKKLYIGVGVNNNEKEKSQDVKYLGGKILRINSDGSIPTDNPFKGSPVYSLGHRNIFGMAFSPINKKLYVCDVGQDADDEINIIEPGGNYGWPNLAGYTNKPGFISPIKTFTPALTPTQCVFYKNDFYFGSYNEGSVHKLELSASGDKVLSDSIVYQGKPFGVVGVFLSPDNDFFIATNDNLSKIKIKGGKQKMKNKKLIIGLSIVVLLAIGSGGYLAFNSYNNSNSNTKTNTQNVQAGTVIIENFSFNPGTITIKKGETVTWQNNDSTIHRIVSDDNIFSLEDMASGATSKHTFEIAGAYNYHCAIHTYMKGSVVVE